MLDGLLSSVVISLLTDRKVPGSLSGSHEESPLGLYGVVVCVLILLLP